MILSIIGIIIAIFFYYQNNEYYGKVFVGCSVSILLFIVFQRMSIQGGIIRTLGKDSMVPYVLHAYFTIPVRLILGHFGILNVVSYTILGTISAMLCSYIVIWLMNNIKVLNKVKYVFYPSKLLKF